MEEFGINKAQKERISRALLISGNEDFSNLKDSPSSVIDKNMISSGICGSMSVNIFKKLKLDFEKKSLFSLAKNSISSDNFSLFFHLINDYPEIKEM